MNPTRFLALTFLSLAAARADVSLEDGIKSHLGKLTDNKSPGIAVLVARDGKIVFQGGFGMADVEKKIPVTVETKFRIGSVTKQFTAAAILRLAEDGKLALTDPLVKFMPDFPRAGEITLHHLLTHTSGIHSFTEKLEFITRVVKPIEPEKLIAWFRDDPADFAPGTDFRYNNSAYFLLGRIIAKVSGKSYGAYLRETFFDPLGMKSTGIYENSSPPDGIALGYSFIDGKVSPAVDWDMSWAGAAGSLYSTVGDLFRWNEALHGGKILKPASLQAMTTPVKLPANVDGMSYGYGLAISETNRLPSISHGGGLNGWSSMLIRFPAQHSTVIALANAMPPVPEFDPGGVTRKITGKFLAEEIAKLPPLKEDPTVDRKTFPDFAGRYDYKSAVLTVSVEDNRLYAQLTGQPKFEIFPSAPNEFFWKVVDARITFLRDEKGKVTAARQFQNGASFRAPRLTEPEVKLTAAELDAITGEYHYGAGSILTVSHEDDVVFAQLTGQPKFPIFPKSATEFEWRITKATLKFNKDKDGKVTGATHSQNGGTIEAPKTK